MITTIKQAEAVYEWWTKKSRESFYHYRQFLNYPNYKKGVFQEDLSDVLTQFYIDFINNRRPILVISAPPQHGKSSTIIDFVTWLIGAQDGIRVIFGSFSERLGIRANRQCQRVFDSQKYNKIYPKFKVGSRLNISLFGRLLRNNDIIETSSGGYFRNTTVAGSITGETLDLCIIDDPIKGRKEANSKLNRETVWNWLTDDVMTRFSEYAGMIVIATRWHVDDPTGRLVDKCKPDEIKVVSFPAVNEKGEALFPELKSKEFLDKIKSRMLPGSWLSLYQQSPVLDGGNIVKAEWWRWGDVRPKIKYRFITADTAQKTKTWNDYTVMQAWGFDYAGNMHLLDMFRARVEAPELRKIAEDFYNRHNKIRFEPLRGMWIEDKSSGTGLIQELKRKNLKVNEVPRPTDKVERSYNCGPEIKSGKIFLYRDVKDVDVIVDEASAAPDGINDDAWDCTMTAIEITYLNKTHIDYSSLI